MQKDSKYFWKFVNDRRKKSGIPSVGEFNGDTATNDSMKAMLFGEFFKQQYATGEYIDLNDILNDCDDNVFDVAIEDDDVRKAFESINVNKGEV